MEVRYATQDDADAGSLVLRRSIVELCQADHKGDDAMVAAWIGNKTPETWRSWVEQDGTELYVAVEHDRIVGVGVVDHTGTIRLNYVSPDHRWRGVSKALLAHMEERVRVRGLRQCLLESTKTARSFYEAAGYRGTGDGGWMSKTSEM